MFTNNNEVKSFILESDLLPLILRKLFIKLHIKHFKDVLLSPVVLPFAIALLEPTWTANWTGQPNLFVGCLLVKNVELLAPHLNV